MNKWLDVNEISMQILNREQRTNNDEAKIHWVNDLLVIIL